METRTALVTGAAQGLGQEFAVALARHGYRVAGLDLVPQPKTAERVLDYVELIADVTDEAQIHEALERVLEHFGTLHVLVNTTGAIPESSFEDTTPEEWRRVVRVNLEAPFLMARAVLPCLKAAGWGRIVNIASVAVPDAPPTTVAYTTSRAGLIGFTRALAAALGPYGITVNAIAPSTAQEASGLVSTLLYVVDAGSGFLTGQTLDVAGGSVYS